MRLTVSQVRLGSIALATGLVICMAPSGPESNLMLILNSGLPR